MGCTFAIALKVNARLGDAYLRIMSSLMHHCTTGHNLLRTKELLGQTACNSVNGKIEFVNGCTFLAAGFPCRNYSLQNNDRGTPAASIQHFLEEQHRRTTSSMPDLCISITTLRWSAGHS
jgi:hypothetical protein